MRHHEISIFQYTEHQINSYTNQLIDIASLLQNVAPMSWHFVQNWHVHFKSNKHDFTKAFQTKFILEFEMTILILGKTSDQGRSFENVYFLSSLKHDFSSEKLLEDLVYYI